MRSSLLSLLVGVGAAVGVTVLGPAPVSVTGVNVYPVISGTRVEVRMEQVSYVQSLSLAERLQRVVGKGTPPSEEASVLLACVNLRKTRRSAGGPRHRR